MAQSKKLFYQVQKRNGDENNAEEVNSNGRHELTVLARDNLDRYINTLKLLYYNLPSSGTFNDTYRNNNTFMTL